MSQNVIQPSFAAGEVSPSLYGRVDMAKYKTGAATMRNFFVDYRGGASTRAGTQFITRCKDSSHRNRLIPFQFSTLNTYALEFGQYYMRPILNGAPVLEPSTAITGITQANPGVVTAVGHGFTSGDTVVPLAIGGMTTLNGGTYLAVVIDANHLSLTTLDGVPINTTGYPAYTSGGTIARVYTLATPYLAADLPLLKFTQSADTLTLCHPSYAPRDLTRTAHWVWTLSVISMGATVAAPTNLTLATTAASTTNFGYTVTAVNGAGEESVAASPAQIASVNIGTTAGTITATWTAVVGAQYYKVYKCQVQPTVSVAPGVAYGYVGLSYGLQFMDGNVIPDYSAQPPRHYNPFAVSAIKDYVITNGGSGYPSTTTATVSDPTGTGAVILPVVVGGVISGFIIQNGGENYTAPTIVLAGFAPGVNFAGTLTVGPATGTYPGVTGYFQQRKLFASPTNAPATLYLSKPGAFKNFDYGNPITDGDSLQFTIASQQVNAIKSAVPMPGGLVIFTSGGVWQMTSGNGANAPVTPSSVVVTPQAYSGASDVPPIAVNYDILYVQDKGSVVRNLQFNLFANIYTSSDATVISNHLFKPHYIQEWAYAEDPFKLIWCVRNDGVMLTLTFLKEQELMGWARHDTKGLYESVCTVQENQTNAVYVIVRRQINGQWVRYIERFVDRVFPQGVEDAWCVDCGLQLPLTYPAAELQAGAASGTAVTFTATAGVFNAGMVGWILRGGGGIATITSYVSPTQVIGKITQNVTTVLPDDDNMPLPAAQGDWSCTQPVSHISGLGHLEGQSVSILGDGNVFAPQTVVNGRIDLNQPVTRLTVGLGFQAQLQTLYLDVGDPTVQGKRKKITAVTVRQENSRGLKVGPRFNALTEIKERTTQNYGQPIPLVTGDERVLITPMYTIPGQICLQQDYPLPASVLAVIPEITVGDTDQR